MRLLGSCAGRVSSTIRNGLLTPTAISKFSLNYHSPEFFQIACGLLVELPYPNPAIAQVVDDCQTKCWRLPSTLVLDKAPFRIGTCKFQPTKRKLSHNLVRLLKRLSRIRQ